MTDQELKELVASLAVSQAKTDEQFRKTDEQFRKTDTRIEKLSKLLGNIGNNQGDIAEEYFVNSLKENLEVAGMSFDTLLNNVGVKTKKIRDEFDILLVNGDSVAVIEVKYPDDVDKLDKKISTLKNLPQYRNYKVYAGIAGFFVPNEAIDKARKKGYFVLQRKGDIIETYADNLKAA